MSLKSCLLIVCTSGITIFASAQKKYNGTLVTKLGQELHGEITVNLEGTNQDLIQVSVSEKNKNNGTKETTITSASFNTAIIRHIIIDGKTYYFRNLQTSYEKSLKNVCVQLVYGTVDCGLFQSGDGTAEHSLGMKFPKSSFHELNSVEYYDESSFTIAIQLSECNSLYKKIIENDETVTWTTKSNREQRIRAYKNIIAEYNSCK